MKTRILFGLVGVLLFSLACSFSIGVGSTPTAAPTATLFPSSTPLPPSATPLPPTPTSLPSTPTALPSTPTTLPPTSASSAAPFVLTANTYEHPQGLFSLNMPQQWSLVDEQDDRASFASDDNTGFLQIIATNTIYPIQGDALLQFAKSIEQGFEIYDDYQFLRQKSGHQVVVVERAFTYEGVPQRVRTYFLADNATVLSLDFWADADVADAYFRFYEKWLDDIFYHTDAMAQLPPYADTWTYTAPDNLFQMEVPMAWYYSSNTGDNAVVERFDEPNGLAFIESLAYDDGTPISKSMAGRFALQLLHEYYANDIKVTDDQVQPDGSERLIWASKGQNTKGITFFETRGTTFLLLTLVADQDAFEAFTPVFNAVIQSYDIP